MVCYAVAVAIAVNVVVNTDSIVVVTIIIAVYNSRYGLLKIELDLAVTDSTSSSYISSSEDFLSDPPGRIINEGHRC